MQLFNPVRHLSLNLKEAKKSVYYNLYPAWHECCLNIASGGWAL